MDLFHKRWKQQKTTGTSSSTTVANRNVPPSKQKWAHNDDDQLETTKNRQPAKKNLPSSRESLLAQMIPMTCRCHHHAWH
jgi:hypothetical protein